VARLAVLLVVAVLGARFASAADDRPKRPLKNKKLQVRINAAIEKGVAYLKTVQSGDGRWPYRGNAMIDHDGGLTALALYAMSASGVPADDAAIRRGLSWAFAHPRPYGPDATVGTYSASLLVLALTRIDEKKHRAAVHRLAALIADAQQSSDMWTYNLQVNPDNGPVRRRFGIGDNSNSQFAVLALWAAYSLTGYEVPARTWQRIRDFYKRTQLSAGGWQYSGTMRGGRGLGRPSMTAAGLVAYVYAVAALTGDAAVARGSPVARKGLKALLKTPSDYSDHYFAYAMERAGTIMNLELEKWYVPGAKHLLKEQKRDGSWRGRFHGDPAGAYDTALALLFLSRTTLMPRRAATTKRDTFPDLSKPGQLARGFDFYHAYKSDQRAKVVHEFGKAGPAAVGLFVEKLHDERESVRVTAMELLRELCDKRFFFDPKAPLDERAVMLEPIDRYWKTQGLGLRWDPARKKFARVR
jgi:hypothetical protein